MFPFWKNLPNKTLKIEITEISRVNPTDKLKINTIERLKFNLLESVECVSIRTSIR